MAEDAGTARDDLHRSSRHVDGNVPTFDRRAILIGSAAMVLPGCTAGGSSIAAEPRTTEPWADRLRAVEQRAGGRLGAYVLDPVTGSGFGWRANERFAHASSFKMSLAAMLLARADGGEIDPAEVLHWSTDDLLPVSPITKAHVDTGLSVRELARATLVTSDNTAANALLRRFGGPSRLTGFWRSIGDDVSRLDRLEPELNVTPPGTALDTTTPAAMAATTARLIQGDVLTPASRTLLKTWMADVRTGDDRIRAGFPAGWVSGDKTGTAVGADRHVYVDLAYGGPAGRPPLIVAAYFEPAQLVAPTNPAATAVLAAVGRIAAASLGAA